MSHQTSTEAQLEALTYFLPPQAIIARLTALMDMCRLASTKKPCLGASVSGNAESYWLNHGRGHIVLTVDSRTSRLEISSLDIDASNAENDNPEFILSRGHDDSCWEVEHIPSSDKADVIQKFSYLTDTFYMDGRSLFFVFLDDLIYEGQSTPEEFTLENVMEIVESYEDRPSA